MNDPHLNPPPRNNNKTLWIVLGGCLVLFVCLATMAVILIAGVFLFGATAAAPLIGSSSVPTAVSTSPAPSLPGSATTTRIVPPTPNVFITPTPETAVSATPIAPTALPAFNLAAPDDIEQAAIAPRAYSDLARLMSTDYPFYDYHETAERLSGEDYGDRTVPASSYQIGDRRTFTTDGDTHEAELVYLSDNVYYWADISLNYEKSDMEIIANRLENDYYPQLVTMFGQEWRPGVDNDTRFGIMHLDTEGGSELGYFSSTDVYPRTIYTDSNEQEVIYMNMGNLDLGEELYYGTLVHEIQHLIQWYVDPNEETWMNEGLSQLAEIYLGLDTAESRDYLDQPDIQVNTWDYGDSVIDAHYSAAYLFNVYFWEQLGDTAVQELARHPANGMAAVAAVLPGYDDRSLNQFVSDWVVANYLDTPAAGPQYDYQTLNLRQPEQAATLRDLPSETVDDIGQFGSQYIDMTRLRGPVTISFAGDTVVNLTDGPPPSGEQMWYAPPQDETWSYLTRSFDLTTVNNATLRFATWYNLEERYDYAYVTISTDGGQTWELLVPANSRAGEYGPAFNGRSAEQRNASNGWVKETVSLNRYVGENVMIRFEVYTDSAITEGGFAIDDIAIPELRYENDGENPSDWESHGFAQIGWQLPQQWSVQLITPDADPPIATSLALDANNQGQWQFDLTKTGGVLAITPLTPFVSTNGEYWLLVEKN